MKNGRAPAALRRRADGARAVLRRTRATSTRPAPGGDAEAHPAAPPSTHQVT
ncbi:MAG: hypothetical protein O9972_33900 [Burkholderiales bacterium]|nr:hypothetical protein [Burkholderiales bacterium]